MDGATAVCRPGSLWLLLEAPVVCTTGMCGIVVAQTTACSGRGGKVGMWVVSSCGTPLPGSVSLSSSLFICKRRQGEITSQFGHFPMLPSMSSLQMLLQPGRMAQLHGLLPPLLHRAGKRAAPCMVPAGCGGSVQQPPPCPLWLSLRGSTHLTPPAFPAS